MAIHSEAGKPASQEQLVNVAHLISAYYSNKPDKSDVSQGVTFGTSGHRGSAFKNTFTDTHIAAISQALAEYRTANKISEIGRASCRERV